MENKIITIIIIAIIIGLFGLIILKRFNDIEIEHKKISLMDTIILDNGYNCNDFRGDLLVRKTLNKIDCNKYDEKLPCNIPIMMNWSLNKQFCNFTKGDIIYIYAII